MTMLEYIIHKTATMAHFSNLCNAGDDNDTMVSESDVKTILDNASNYTANENKYLDDKYDNERTYKLIINACVKVANYGRRVEDREKMRHIYNDAKEIFEQGLSNLEYENTADNATKVIQNTANELYAKNNKYMETYYISDDALRSLATRLYLFFEYNQPKVKYSEVGDTATIEALGELDYVSDSQDVSAVLEYVPVCDDKDSVTAALVEVGDGEYNQVWVTWSSKLYAAKTRSKRVL